MTFWGREELFFGFISTMTIPKTVTLILVSRILVKIDWIKSYQG